MLHIVLEDWEVIGRGALWVDDCFMAVKVVFTGENDDGVYS